MKKAILVVVIFAAGAAAGFVAGRRSSAGDERAAMLARELETISLCANGLNSLDSPSSKTARLLDHRLRSAVSTAAQHADASAAFQMPTPNLVDGLSRAKNYAERSGDAQLAADIARLQSAIEQPAS